MAGAGAFLVTIISLAAGAWLFRGMLPQKTDDAVCTERLGVECEQLTPEAIGRVAEMTLPPGTTVESSSYRKFQDWHLAAVFVVPADLVGVWEASLTRYPEPTALGCQGLEGRGTDRRCADGGASDDPPWRKYVRVTQPDGSVVVAVEVFTT